MFFDDIGSPWPIHDCSYKGTIRRQASGAPSNSGPSYWPSLLGVSIIRGGSQRNGLLPGFRRSTDSIDTNLVRRAREATNLNREIMRIEPIGEKAIEIVGVVRELASPDLAKRYNLSRGNIGFNQLSKLLGDADPIQVTLFIDEFAVDSAAVDYMSYTFLAPRARNARKFHKGNVLQASLMPIEILGAGRLWKANALERLI